MPNHSQPQRGFTLIELVLAITLVVIMAGMLTPLGTSAVRAYQSAQTRLKSQDTLRYAIERLSRELREVSYSTTTGFAFAGPLSATPVSQITFNRLYYDSAGTASASATIGLLQSGSQLRMSDSRYPDLGTQLLCENVASLQLSFLDEAGQVLSAPTPLNVVSVDITLTLDSAGTRLSQSTRVHLKNRQKA